MAGRALGSAVRSRERHFTSNLTSSQPPPGILSQTAFLEHTLAWSAHSKHGLATRRFTSPGRHRIYRFAICHLHYFLYD